MNIVVININYSKKFSILVIQVISLAKENKGG